MSEEYTVVKAMRDAENAYPAAEQFLAGCGQIIQNEEISEAYGLADMLKVMGRKTEFLKSVATKIEMPSPGEDTKREFDHGIWIEGYASAVVEMRKEIELYIDKCITLRKDHVSFMRQYNIRRVLQL